MRGKYRPPSLYIPGLVNSNADEKDGELALHLGAESFVSQAGQVDSPVSDERLRGTVPLTPKWAASKPSGVVRTYREAKCHGFVRKAARNVRSSILGSP